MCLEQKKKKKEKKEKSQPQSFIAVIELNQQWSHLGEWDVFVSHLTLVFFISFVVMPAGTNKCGQMAKYKDTLCFFTPAHRSGNF